MREPSNNPLQMLVMHLDECQLKSNLISLRQSFRDELDTQTRLLSLKGAVINLYTEGCNPYFPLLAGVKQADTS